MPAPFTRPTSPGQAGPARPFVERSRAHGLLAFAFVFTVTVVSSNGAHAEVPTEQTGTADEAEVSFRLGNQAYLDKNFRAALGYYFASNRLAPNRNVIFNIARCYESLGDLDEAHRYYSEHARLSPEGDPKRAESEAALARISPSVALVQVRSKPAGAAIYLNRRDLGVFARTPSDIATKAGTYTLIVEAPGHRPATRTGVVAERGKRVLVELELEPLTATLELTGSPAGATVRWQNQGNTVATTTLPGRITGPSGDLRLVVESPGWMTRELDLRVGDDEQRKVEVRLDPEVGSLVVDGDEPGALIRLDGEPVGFVPAVLDRVVVGSHRLEVGAEGFTPFSTTVQVSRDARAEVYASLAATEDVLAASRTVESALTAPASVGLVSAYELRMHAMHSLLDALSAMRGTYVTNDYTYASLGFRGVAPLGDFSNRVQTQLDGHVINLSYDGSSNMGYEGLAGLVGVDRVEIIRGPGSALYGSGATFGVINVGTPDGVEGLSGQVGLSSLADGRFGLWGRSAFELPEGVWMWVAGGLIYAEPRDYLSPSRVGSDEHPDGIAHGVGEELAGNLMGKLGWGDLTLQWFYNDRLGTPSTAPFGADFDDPRLEIVDRRAFFEARYEPSLTKDTRLFLRLAWDHSYYYGLYPQGEDAFTEAYFGSSVLLEGRVRSAIAHDLTLTAGLLGQYGYDNRLQNGDVGGERLLDEDRDSVTVALYGLLEYAITPEIALHGGLRFDGRAFLSGDAVNADTALDKDGFQGALSPRLAMVWSYREASALKVVLGSAFRAPSFYELAFGDGGDTQLPPETLAPERIYSGEVEVTHALSDDLALVGGVFINSVLDSVTLDGEGNPTSPLVYTNRDGNVSVMGLELELRHSLRQGLMWSLSYGLTRARLGGLFDGEALENSPTHHVTGRAIVPIVPLVLSFVTRVSVDSGRRDLEGAWTPASLLWDAGFSGRLEKLGLDYSLQFKNLLDLRQVHPGSGLIEDVRVPQPGRSILAELTKRF